MSDLMLGNITTTDFGNVKDFNYEVPQKNTDGALGRKRNEWSNPNSAKYYGFYYEIGEYRAAINDFATWIIGQGYDADIRTKTMLDNITGWGEDTCMSILWNMFVVKKFNGDSYAEIINNDEGTLINLKVLDPRRVKHIISNKGTIEEYEYTQGDGEIKTFKPNEILHFCNDRVLDEPHGTSVTSAVEWVCTALKEAYIDWKRMMHKSSLLIFYVDEQDEARQTKLKTDMATGIAKGDVLILTCKPEEARLEPAPAPPAQAWLLYVNNLEDKFYKQLGVSKSVISGTAENTEAAAKMDRANTDPIFTREANEIESDLWNQMGIRIKIRRQPNIMDNVQSDEQKNTGQTKLQYSGGQ
jgi:hypothetical protein